jgi:hypothetical protein
MLDHHSATGLLARPIVRLDSAEKINDKTELASCSLGDVECLDSETISSREEKDAITELEQRLNGSNEDLKN